MSRQLNIDESVSLYKGVNTIEPDVSEAFGRLLEIARGLDSQNEQLAAELADTKAQLRKRDEQLLRVMGYTHALGDDA